MISRRVVLTLLAIAAVLLVALTVVTSLVLLLDQFADAEGATIARRLAVACLVALAVDLICLLLALGLNAADPPNDRGRAE